MLIIKKEIKKKKNLNKIIDVTENILNFNNQQEGKGL